MDGPSETEPLLRPAAKRKVTNHQGYSSLQDSDEINRGARYSFEEWTSLCSRPRTHFCDTGLLVIVPDAKKQLGLASTVMLIFNSVIGTGVFAAPSIILRTSGSVGMTFVMWILGALVASAGTAVYVEFGTVLGTPKKWWGEDLHGIYLSPTKIYDHLLLRGIRIADNTLHAFAIRPTTINVRAVGVLCTAFCLIMHGVFLKYGLKLQNALGFFKLFVLLFIAVSGLFSFTGVPGFIVRAGYDTPHNYTWPSFWEGSNIGLNAFVTGMYNVIWAYIGYSDANYALSEVRDPIRTIKRAAPFAVLLVTLAYVAVNLAYFAVVSKQDMLEGGTTAANIFGPATERVLSAIIALSTLGTVMSMMFTQGRVIQELGREGVLPFSSFFASSKPFDAPLAGMFTHTLICMITLTAAPPGDAYLFIVNFGSYPLTMFNLLISGGLLALYTPALKSYGWSPPFRAWKPVIVFFFLSNVFLAIVPMIPPSPGFEVYKHLPYWSHVILALLIGLVGIIYWFVCFDWIPRKQGYRLVRETVLQDDGVSRNVLRKIPNEVDDEGSG
ncbi:amino acid transporter [Rhizopogon salebrosus TDB-379]|nr:amino acid transporter [Rhizopogon salebrosus TDB-379]